MSEIIKKSWAYAKANTEFIYLQTYSGYINCLPDRNGLSEFLRPDSKNEEIGAILLAALAASRFLLPQDEPSFFDFSRASKEYDEWVKQTMTDFSYKNKRTMFKSMKSCGIEEHDGLITIRPSHHEKLEAWSGDGISEEDYVVIPATSGPEEIGAALRLAFSRCIG